MARVQINCEVVCKACFTHILYIWTVIIIICHTIAIKVIDTHITNSLGCRKILKTQNQHKARGCIEGVQVVPFYLLPGFMANSIFRSNIREPFESALMSDSLSFTIGSRLMPQTAFNDWEMTCCFLWSTMHREWLIRTFPLLLSGLSFWPIYSDTTCETSDLNKRNEKTPSRQT